jgi:hypothetical protein
MQEIIKVGKTEIVKRTHVPSWDNREITCYWVDGQFFATLATARCEARRLNAVRAAERRAK